MWRQVRATVVATGVGGPRRDQACGLRREPSGPSPIRCGDSSSIVVELRS
jgi:hypothetical protein